LLGEVLRFHKGILRIFPIHRQSIRNQQAILDGISTVLRSAPKGSERRLQQTQSAPKAQDLGADALFLGERQRFAKVVTSECAWTLAFSQWHKGC
jgi:hypothetical protein